MAEATVVVTTPETQVESEEVEVTWESVLSEIRTAILDGFSSLRAEQSQQREASETTIRQLMEQNTNLQSMITSANQTLMDKLTLLTPTQLQNPPEVTVVEVQASEEADQRVQETPVAETVVEETPVPTRRKRRTL